MSEVLVTVESAECYTLSSLPDDALVTPSSDNTPTTMHPKEFPMYRMDALRLC